jgi:hypothetical protein
VVSNLAFYSSSGWLVITRTGMLGIMMSVGRKGMGAASEPVSEC